MQPGDFMRSQIGDQLMRTPNGAETDRLLAYVADLELEVDRLRRQSSFVERHAVGTLSHILRLCTRELPGEPLPTLNEVRLVAGELVEVIRDLHDSPGYHPAHDQVVAIAVRPLAEQVFRWQQRLTSQRSRQLRLDLQTEHVEWFPARLRHIIDSLIACALQWSAGQDHADSNPIVLTLGVADADYELRIAHDGTPPAPRLLELLPTAAPIRESFGGGLAVVKLLVEQSGGSMLCTTAERRTEFVLRLPRYDLLDFLE